MTRCPPNIFLTVSGGISRQFVVAIATLLLVTLPSKRVTAANEESPNFVVIFCDDLGYGDLSCFGHPTIRTPSLDRMAAEGQRWTSFYVAAPVCTPSRAGLMTGRLPIRNGMTSRKRVVLFPDSGGGLPDSEITIAEMLRQSGYATACIGKWHLGHLPPFLPQRQGFDTYFGIPYSNDMHRPKGVPLMRGDEIIERPVNQKTVTKRYTEEAVKFIRDHADQKFFLYLPHTMPHIPLYVSKRFKGTSPRGLYGDVIEEIDHSVGQIMEALREAKCDDRTVVVFTSDNGPWLSFKLNGGSAGLLRAGKGTTFEGGMRVPTIFRWPAKIPANSVVTEMGSTLDLMATFANLAGCAVPNDRQLDSYDLSGALTSQATSPRNEMFYWTRGELYAVRIGKYKLHFKSRKPIKYGQPPVTHDPPLLYDLEFDPGEKYDIAKKNPEIVARIKELAQQHRQSIAPAPDQLAIPLENPGD